MMISALLLLALPFAAAFRHSASSYAGSTTTDVFPPPDASYTVYEEYFPNESEVGYAGATPTGAQPEAIQTAPAAAVKMDTYPLVAEGHGHEKFNPMRYWGNLSPWFSVGGAFGLPDTSPQVPQGCELTQVHIVQRHGARYPPSGTNGFAALLHAAVVNGTGFSARGPLRFLNTWSYKLGAEILTPFGRQQLFDLGAAYKVKYGHLLNGFTGLPIFRTPSQWRMVQSARNWAAGFFGLEEYPTAYYEEFIIEESTFNSTLSPWFVCPNAFNDFYRGPAYANQWSAIYLNDTVRRLQRYIRGVNLTTTHVSEMMDLCAYESVAIGYSKFCELFTKEEWEGYQYASDIMFWYTFGPGSSTGAAQGIGYVQELVARLTQTLMTVFDTTTNGTLDGNNITFPLSQPIYMDATHDAVVASVAVAMNFTSFSANGPLPLDHIPDNLTYKTQYIVPFATNLVGQVMTCPVRHGPFRRETYIRWLLNDGAVPLTGIKGCEKPNKDGLCLLTNFVEGMKERIAEIDFQHDCYANASLAGPK